MEASKIDWSKIGPGGATTEAVPHDAKEQIATPEQEFPQGAQPLDTQPKPFKIDGSANGEA
jgi:hypothetical protein